MKFTGRAAAQVAALSFNRFFQSLLPSVGKSYAGKPLRWDNANAYFAGMEDPFKTFQFTLPDGTKVSRSTAGLLKIERDSWEQARNALSSALSGLETAGIITTAGNPFGSNGAPQLPVAYNHLANPTALLTAYPFTNDVYQANPTRKVEGLAVPNVATPVWVTPKVFDATAFPTDRMFSAMTEILTAIRLLHGACNANAMMSPAVHIGLNRLGFTETLFNAMDSQAAVSVVPKRRGIPAREANRGAWSDNRFFGDPRDGATYAYSNKNIYLPGLGNFDSVAVDDIYRDGSVRDDTTKFVNPCFPEWFRPIHYASLAPAGSPATAGFVISGQTDRIYRLSADRRRAVYTFSDVAEFNGGAVAYNSVLPGNAPDGWLQGGALSGNVFYSYFSGVHDPAIGEGTASRNARRLRDWYLRNKPKCDIRMADAVTDFATIVQLARFLSEVPPHVLLHSVMGFHNALVKMSFEYVGVPYSTSITEYQAKMRMERTGILELSNNSALENVSGSTDIGYALTVKPPDSVVLEDATLRDVTIATLQLSAAATVANPAVGAVCFALAGIAILVAEITGGRAQPLITPRDRSREDLRDTPNGGVRCNWFRGYTPEMIVNTIPVVRV